MAIRTDDRQNQWQHLLTNVNTNDSMYWRVSKPMAIYTDKCQNQLQYVLMSLETNGSLLTNAKTNGNTY